MPNPSNAYICPRCNYNTPLKRLMKRHFETLKNPCPERNAVVLTPEIIEHVLLNHQFSIVPKLEQNQDKVVHDERLSIAKLNQTFNNFNMVNAIVSNMESLEKIKCYQDIRQIDFEDRLEKDFQSKLEK